MSLQPEAYFQGRALTAARAIAAGDVAQLQQALRAGAGTPADPAESRMSLVLFALLACQYPCLETLLRLKADPNQPTVVGHETVQPVAVAAEHPDPFPLRLLLAYDGDPNSRSHGEPALCGAIYARNWSSLRLLAEHPRINLNAATPEGTTPLLLLSYFNQFEQVAYLLGKGADHEPTDDSGGTVAFVVQSTELPPGEVAHLWQQRVRQLLELRGVRFPVPDPRVEWEQKREAEEKLRQQWNRSAEGRTWNEQVNLAAETEGLDGDDGLALMHLRKAAEVAYRSWKERRAPSAHDTARKTFTT